ncbi:hypothetical protein [Nocardia altamirensis]|uniref:hypothetical protein n=1 Tax=Nocardia altamirensis TaxID=472158 RepID=UPI00084066D0|nr:hypothetical protein [Nocardia altamirensis]
MSGEKFEDATGVSDLAVDDARSPLARLVAGVAALGRPGLRRVDAAFAVTTSVESARIICTDGTRVSRIEAPPALLALARAHRAEALTAPGGPWWRVLVRINAFGAPEVDYDYGDEPFPGDQLFRPEVYQADVAAYPRPRLPVWLAAYMTHGNRQSRTKRRADIGARADRTRGLRPTPVDADVPGFPEMWARWATISAACEAVAAEPGPRVVPDTCWYESARNGSSGSSLYVLPGGRAVLSGGVWAAPALNAAYNGGIDLPNLYAGAPDWVTNAVLNPRAAVGLLSFCFWWEGGRWYRGESPSMEQCGVALPPIWTASTVLETVARLLWPQPNYRQRAAVARLSVAAERAEVTPELVRDAVGAHRDVAGALRQVVSAGLMAPSGATVERGAAPNVHLLDGWYLCNDRIAL